jgi:glutamate formiminotransferase / 5-formyltetrahydrofolate cyclo-ligase
VALPLESVPNFSEGRDPAAIAALERSLSQPGRLLDIHTDWDHHRSVFTIVGPGDDLVETLVAGISTPAARAAALALAERVADDLGLPVFFYGRLTEDRREPAFFRRGGPDELQRRIDSEEIAPDRGPATLHPSAGGVLIGVRRPLIAFNVNLRGATVEAAREIAALVRERDGGFPGVRALGLDLPKAGLVQVSMNVTDWEAAALHTIVATIVAEAETRGAEVAGSELVGLMPAGAAVEAAGNLLRIEGFDAGHVLELRLLDD